MVSIAALVFHCCSQGLKVLTLGGQSLPIGVCSSPGCSLSHRAGWASLLHRAGRLCVDNSASQASSLGPLVDAGRQTAASPLPQYLWYKALYFNKSLRGRCTLSPEILNSQDRYYCKYTTLLILQISRFNSFIQETLSPKELQRTLGSRRAGPQPAALNPI